MSFPKVRVNRLARLVDNDVKAHYRGGSGIDWRLVWPFIGVHLACFAVILVGWSWVAIATAVGLYAIRMFAITAFYHRYFAHRSFKTSRTVQFIFALIGNMSAQRGPLWWAAHHRQHHAASDRPNDVHSPKQHGFWRAHLGWFLQQESFATRRHRINDWLRYPELRWLDRYDLLVPILLALGLFGMGTWLEWTAPQLNTNGWQLLVWGFFVSTTVLYHATYTVNSLAHLFGNQPFKTGDESRNNFWIALLTFGEGWHNNHHHYPASVRQGFQWWQIDLSYYLLRCMAWLGLIWDLKPVPSRVLRQAQR